jgi:hypothetical protein
MTNQHPITPPPELVASLRNSAPHGIREPYVTRELWLINSAYAAGADQELEACVKLANEMLQDGNSLRAARRPNPLRLKEEALALLDQHEEGWRPSPKDWDTIRTAIEALPND